MGNSISVVDQEKMTLSGISPNSSFKLGFQENKSFLRIDEEGEAHLSLNDGEKNLSMSGGSSKSDSYGFGQILIIVKSLIPDLLFR